MKQNGFSLIEMMVGIVVSLMLAATTIQYFSSQKATYRIQDGLSRLQENAGFASYVLQEDLRMAGFQGCPKMSNVQPNVLALNVPDTTGFGVASIVTGHKGSSGATFTPGLPTWLSSNIPNGFSVKPNTDVVIIRKASQQGASLSAGMLNTTDPIPVTNRMTFAPTSLLIVSDCENVDLIRASSGTTNTNITHTNVDNSSGSLSKAYSSDAMVFPYQVTAYYIRDTGRTNRTGAPIFGLFRMDQSGAEEEISEGIENLQISYGVDTNSDSVADVYQTADVVNNASNWDKVVSVNASLLANTIDGASDKLQNYRYNGQTNTSTDHLLRREWKMFISLRNKGA